MSNKELKIFVLTFILIIALLIVSCNPNNPITGFAVLDENATANETTNITQETASAETAPTTEETAATAEANTTTEEKEKKTSAEKPEEKPKPEKTEPNVPPVWKSDVNEFVVKGITVIDLNDYFSDENNDAITYTSTSPEKILVEISNNLVTLTPLESNFSTLIEFRASDGEKSTTHEATLIVPEKSISINLQYKLGTSYDSDDNGYEPTYGVVDLTVENSQFSWAVNESNLCTRWEVYSIESEESTTVCYGAEKCCGFIGLGPTRESWKDDFYSVYGQYGATLNNIVSARILYVDYGVRDNKPYTEIYNSEWRNLSANYYFASIDFENVCVDTCFLTGFNESSYKLIFEIDGAVLNLDKLTYSIVEEITKVLLNLEVKDDSGLASGSYQLYKDNAVVSIAEGFVEPDYYDIEVTPTQDVIDKLIIERVNITKPITASIGVDDVSREISISNVDAKKRYAVNLEELEFEKATLQATAHADSLYKCKQWDYEREVCFGEWIKIKDLVVGQQYELTLTKEDPGFIEGNLNVTPRNITGLALIRDIPDITTAVNKNTAINLSEYFSNVDDAVSFTYLGQEGITILFEKDIATIVPAQGFIGTVYTFITASKNGDSAFSNVFRIEVTKVEVKDCSNFIMTDDGQYYCEDDEKFYSCKGFEDIATGDENIGNLLRCKEAKFVKDNVDKSVCPFKHKDCNVTVDMDKGWGDRQTDEKSSYKLSTFKENFYCGSGHCEVPFYFKGKADISGRLDFNVTADALLSNISVKRVLEGKNETAGKVVSMKLHDSYYYIASFDYEPVWTDGVIKTTKPLKFNISASLDGIKILELDPIAFESFATDNSVDIRDVAIPNIPVTCSLGDILIIGFLIEGAGTPSVTYGGQTADLINTADATTMVVSMYNSSNCNGASQNVVVSVSGGGNNKDAIGMVSRYSGADRVDDTADITAIGTVSPATVTVNTAVAGDYAVDVVGVLDPNPASPIAVTPGGNVNERSTLNGVYSGSSRGGMSDDGGLTGGGAAMSWTITDAAWGIVAVPLLAPVTPDATLPIVNTTFNITSPQLNDVINFTGNMTDNVGLSTANITFNMSGVITYANYTLSGKSANISNVTTITTLVGSVINFTMYATDTNNNVKQNSTLIIVVDTTLPIVNTTLNKSLTNILQNDVINITANATDENSLSFCQIIINQSGPSALHFVNISLNGAITAQCSNVSEVTLAAGGVINYTIMANDTSNNFRTNDTIITVVSAATAPVIKLNNASTFSVDPIAASDVLILISFNVTDAQGIGNINASKAVVNLTLGYETGQWRDNVSATSSEFGTCFNHTEPGPGIESARIIINCTVVMRYYDNASSNWFINVSVQDLDNLIGRNGSTFGFTYNTLSALSLPISFINFSSVFLGEQDKPSSPLMLNNTGNEDFDTINISAADLVGTTVTTESIAVTTIVANITNATAGLGVPLALGPVTIRELIQSTGDLENATLVHGHTRAFAPNADKGNRTVYFYIDVPSSGLSSQLYNATFNVTVVNNP